jgi:hypothetical protein
MIGIFGFNSFFGGAEVQRSKGSKVSLFWFKATEVIRFKGFLRVV